MKTKTLLILLAIFAVGSAVLPAETTTNQWSFYEASPLAERLSYLQSQRPADLSDAFLLQALLLADSEDLEKGTDNVKQEKRALGQWLCQALGTRKVVAAAQLLGRIPAQYKDPFLRGEAWLALARMGDSRAVLDMIRELGQLNAGAVRGRSQEVMASYILQSLALLKATGAFRDTAVASLGWYTAAGGIRELARKSLGAMSSDVFASKLDLLRNDDDLIFRESLFLDLGVESDPVAGGKAAEAVLSTLVTFQMRDSLEKDAATRLLKASLMAANAAPAPPPALSGPMKTLIDQKKADMALKMIAVRVLAHIGDPVSIDILVKNLGDFNLKQKQGVLTADELALVREIIFNLGAVKKSAGRAVLQDVRFSDYVPAVVTLALEALDKLEP
ncbi:MAG: hypothetical protein WCG80_14870 [Spirochaetales bacterium]